MSNDTNAVVLNRRILLVAATISLAVVGIALVLQPLLESMSPNAVARKNYEQDVLLAAIPAQGFMEVSWQSERVFLSKQNGIKVFTFPYWYGKYWLPDPTWDRPVIACLDFVFRERKFSCQDFDPYAGTTRQWNHNGKSGDPYIADLRSPPYTLLNDRIVLGRKETIQAH